MTSNTHNLLVLMVPEAIKDKVVDTLIAQPSLSGFSLSKIQGFSAKNNHFNIQEQVEGYKDLYRFEVLHEIQQTEALIALVKTSFKELKFRFWVTPVLYAG
ncbi:DUF3240 family protein [Glaciecola sp. SC05]|uniref:DUF3240 family protein n=1 Tax=Glaciecola sp. SC05 TaxID=1987355 RepID=UPI0035282E0F